VRTCWKPLTSSSAYYINTAGKYDITMTNVTRKLYMNSFYSVVQEDFMIDTSSTSTLSSSDLTMVLDQY